MKIGVRKPSLKKAIKASTTGKAKRAVKKAVNPLYGKKGVGLAKSPRACDGRWSMLDAMNSISVISMVYEVKPLFFRGRVREALWRKLRDQYLNMEAEIEIER